MIYIRRYFTSDKQVAGTNSTISIFLSLDLRCSAAISNFSNSTSFKVQFLQKHWWEIAKVKNRFSFYWITNGIMVKLTEFSFFLFKQNVINLELMAGTDYFNMVIASNISYFLRNIENFKTFFSILLPDLPSQPSKQHLFIFKSFVDTSCKKATIISRQEQAC